MHLTHFFSKPQNPQCDFRNSCFRDEAEDSTLLVKEVARIQTQTYWAFCSIRLPRYQGVCFHHPHKQEGSFTMRPPGGFQSGAAAGRLKLPEKGWRGTATGVETQVLTSRLQAAHKRNSHRRACSLWVEGKERAVLNTRKGLERGKQWGDYNRGSKGRTSKARCTAPPDGGDMQFKWKCLKI